MWFKRHALCKSMEKRKKFGHMKVQVYKKWWAHEGSCEKKKKEKEDRYVLKIKLMR
jgi:hypothetical protein